MTIKIWYILEHNEDGTINPIFMETEELCNIQKRYSHDYWYENTVNYITIDSESSIIVKEVVTVEQYFNDLQEDLNNSDVNKDDQQELRNKYNAVKKLMESL